MMQHDPVRSRPPEPRQVARRLLGLRCVVDYAWILTVGELDANDEAWSQGQREAFQRTADQARAHMQEYVRAWKLWDELTPRERAFMLTPAGAAIFEERRDISWRVEAARVLMWALYVVDATPPVESGTRSDPTVLESVPWEDPGRLERAPKLRPAAEITRARDLAELWHWRSRTRELVERGDTAKSLGSMDGRSFDDIVRNAAEFARSKGDLSSVVDGDFGVNGAAFRDLTPEDWEQVKGVIIERHFALNWLCGYAPGNRWDETPTET